MYGKRSSHLQKIHPYYAGKNILSSPPAPCQFDGLCSLLRNLSHSGYFTSTNSSQYPLFSYQEHWALVPLLAAKGAGKWDTASNRPDQVLEGSSYCAITLTWPSVPRQGHELHVNISHWGCSQQGSLSGCSPHSKPRAVLLKGSLQLREHQPWKMKHYGRWKQTSVYESFHWAVFQLKCWMEQHAVAEGCTTGRWREQRLDFGTRWLQGVSP